MALIAAGMSPSQFSTPSVYYQPRPSYPAPSARYTPPAPRPSPTQAGPSDWSRLSAFANSEAGQQHLATQQPQPEQGGFWGSPFGKGLGFVINNPVTRVATAPLNYLQTGGRAITLGIEELAEATEGVPDWMKMVSPLGLMTAAVDTDRTEADKRSNWEKLLNPHTTYGYGELLDPDNPKWINRIGGLAGDVITDPLTYVGGGATRAVAGASHVDEAARGLKAAGEFLKVAEEAGDAGQIAKATERIAQYEDYVRRAPEMGNLPTANVPMPRNKAERVNLLAELTETPAGRQFITEMPAEASRAGTRGFQTISQEAKDLLGISKPGLRIRGIEGARIPGTGPIAEFLNWGGGGIRQKLADLPGGESKFRNILTPKGLEAEYNTLGRGGPGDLMRAASNVQGRITGRPAAGAQVARGNRVLSHAVKNTFKGMSDDAIRTMVDESERLAEPNAINKIAAKMLEVYSSVTGRQIDPKYLRNPDTYFPHLIDPKWRRILAKTKGKGDKAVEDFLHITGTKSDELLEDPAFYADNLMEGSGFLEKARVFGTDKDGNPQTFNIGGKEVTFEADDVGHINEKLREAFPTYEGDFYDTDPVRVLEAYNKSLSRQAARDVSSRRMVDVGNPLAFELGGPIDETRLAMNKALAQQNEAGLLSTAQGRYDPTQPLPSIPEAPPVPGASTRPQVQALEAAARGATSPEEAAALTAEAAATPARVPGVGGVKAEEYFVTTKGKEATAQRATESTRAKTYAKAAAAELNKAEIAMRTGVYDLNQQVIKPLRTSIKDTTAEIRTLNGRIKSWAKRLKEIKPLTAEASSAADVDEVAAIITKVEAEVSNAETKLKRTTLNWKGRATRKQRSVEAKLRTEVERLKGVRDAAWEKARAAPEAIAREIEFREQTLNQPVREANEALLYAEMGVGPVPHPQHIVDDAMNTIMNESDLGKDPEELLARWRGLVRDWEGESKQVKTEGVVASPEGAALREQFGQAQKDVEDIARRPRRRGRLSRANQEEYDAAIAKRNKLARQLGEKRAEAPQLAAAREQFDEAQKAVDEITSRPRPRVAKAEQAEADRALEAELDAAIAKRNRLAEELGEAKKVKGAPTSVSAYDEEWNKLLQVREDIKEATAAGNIKPGDLQPMRAERNRLQRLFNPGGRFAKEKKARDVLDEMERYRAKVHAETRVEREALERELYQRQQRQEAIIWKNTEKTARYTTAHGERPGVLEEMGRGLHEQRVVEPVSMPARSYDYATQQQRLVAGPEGGAVLEQQPILPPRSEQEAIASLGSLQATGGGTGTRTARGQAQAAEREANLAEQALPGEISKQQARVAQETAAAADAELGPLANRAQVHTNLLDDLTNKLSLVTKRDEARALRDRLGWDPRKGYTDIDRTLNEIEAVAKANPLLDDTQMSQVESLLQSHRAELERIGDGRMRVADLDRVVADAESGKLGKVMIATLNNNWKALHNGPLNTGDIIMDAELHKRFTNLFELSRQPKMLGRTFNAFTNLFKTYATLSPGFFVRNAIGGVFMNTADGVTLRAQEEGARLWHQWMKGGEDWLAEQPQRVRQAFAAAAGSGAGGRFEESGVLAKTESALYNAISSNRATRAAQRWGTRVEGAMRMGMALDSVDKGMGVEGALQRITRVHFDYGQVSEIDETMKRIIPFWTFMSRNLPLQIQEQWTNPRVYSYYDHVISNFSLPDEEFTPEYWTRQGAWRTPVSIGGAPLYLQPDLGFTRVQGDVQALGGALGGDNPGLLFSQANPIIGATLDFMNKRDSFYNRAYGPEDYSKMSGPVGAPISLLAQALGQTNEEGQVSDNFMNYLQSLAPPLNQVQRLFPGATGADSTAQTWVKRARYGGAPIQLLTPETQDSEYWRQWRAMQDEQDRLQAMAKEAAS